jgi:hypothetical protein
MSHQIAVCDATVIEVEPLGRYGKLRVDEPTRSELGFGYLIWSDNEVQTLPMVLTKGRQVRCEVWTPNQDPGRHIARNIWVFAEEN